MATKIGAGIGVDTRELKSFIRALRKASPLAAKGLREELRAAGEIVATEARSIASQHSTSIPATIKTQVRGGTVSVLAGGPDVPLAALYELGNKGGSRNPTFRHPVYGHNDRPWVEQPRYPFLRTAAKNKEAEIDAAVMKVADKVVETIAEDGMP